MYNENKLPYVEIVPFYPVSVLKTEDYFLYPAQIMKEKGYHPKIFTFTTGKENKNDCFEGIPISRFNNPLALYRSLPKNVILHCHGMTRKMLLLYFLLFFSKRNIIKIATPHTSFGIYLPYGLKFKIHKICKFIFNSFDAIITQTPYEKEFYIRNGFRNIYELPLAIDYNFFSRIKENNFKDISFKEKYGIKEATFVLLFMGGDRSIKNPKIVLETFNLVKKQKNNCKLFVIGCSDDLSITRLRNIVQEEYKNDVFFLKRLNPGSEIYTDIFKAGNIFINSSMIEGFCLGVYEAAACGMALCIPDIQPFTSVFKERALYHHPNDSIKLKDNILSYINNSDLRQSHIYTNKELMKNYDISQIKQLLWKIYEKNTFCNPKE